MNNYSPISVINSEQLIRSGYIRHTDFSKEMYKEIIDSSYEKKYYNYAKYDCTTYAYEQDIASYVLINSFNKNTNALEDTCLGSMVVEDFEMQNGTQDYRTRQIGKQFGIVPTIPYKYVSKMAKMYRERPVVSYSDYFALGYYPSEKINFSKKYCWVDLVDDSHYVKDYDLDLLPKRSEFNITNEKFLLPTIIEDKLELKFYNVYREKKKNGIEIKAIKYNDEWFRINPVIWRKIGEDLVCTNILFETPVHMNNNYVKNNDVQSFNDTFLKWYVDNVFTLDLFKYVDCTFMEEQMLLELNEDINSKINEVDRLKKIRENLIINQNQQELVIDNPHINRKNFLDEEEVNKRHR